MTVLGVPVTSAAINAFSGPLDLGPVLVGVVALALVAAFVILRRRGRPLVMVRRLDAVEAQRYLAAFAGAEGDFELRPEVAIAQARGIVEEVLRRMGFPDRIDATAKARDLAAHDRAAGAALEDADRSLQESSGRESLHRALTSYRAVLYRLLEAGGGE
jgi:hypothetical protein